MDWPQAITSGVTVVVLSALAPLAMRAPPEQEGAAVLRLPKLLRLIAWFAILFFAAVLAGLSYEVAVGTASPSDARALWIGVPFLILMIVGALGELRVHLHLNDQGIRGRTAFRGHRSIAWQDIVTVSWSGGGYWFKLADRHGETLRVSAWLQGHAQVVEQLQAQVPEAVWEKAIAQWQRRKGS